MYGEFDEEGHKQGNKSMKSLRVLFTADLHMSNKLPFSKPVENGLTDRFQDQLLVLEKIFDVAKREKVDAIFILGDLFDKALVDPVTLTHTIQTLVENDKRPIFILPGNHDASSVKGGRYIVEACGAMDKKHIRVIQDEPFELDGETVRFWPMAFKALGDNLLDLESIRKNDAVAKLGTTNFDVLLMHNSVIGARHMNWVCDSGLDGNSLCSGFDRIYSGHFHTPQKFGTNGMYVGAPMHHHFGDAGRDTVCVITEFRKDKIIDKLVKIDSPRFHSFDNLEGGNLEKGVKSGDYVRFNIEATQADWINLKPSVEALFVSWSKLGLNLSYVHKPVYHHESRMVGLGVETGDVTLENAISNYVDSMDLPEFNLDSGELKKLGLELLAAARQSK